MKNTKERTGNDPEIAAMQLVYGVLRDLDQDAQKRVLVYVRNRLGIGNAASEEPPPDDISEPEEDVSESHKEEDRTSAEDSDHMWGGVSAVAKKWVTRNGLDNDFLTKLFSIGGEEIDLIAKNKEIPAKSKRQRMREVTLLKAIAAYLSSGAARVSHDAVKEACSHYGAYDATNFATYMKALSAEVSGSKEAGYTLTPRGLSAGADLIKQMAGNPVAS